MNSPRGSAAASLIPRDVLFGNPVKALPAISPDGRRLAYIAPSAEGILNVWVRTLGAADDVQVTRDAYRGIRTCFWAEDDRHLLYLQDNHGDENFHVFAVDLAQDTIRDLTPFEGVKAENLLLDPHRPGEMLVGLNRRDPQVFDMHRVQIASGAIALDVENPGDVLQFVADADFTVRAAMSMDPGDGSTELRVRAGAGAAWRRLLHWPFGEEGNPIEFSDDGRAIFLTTTIGADTSRLVAVEVATGAELETLAVDPLADVGAVMVHPDTRRVQAAGFNYQRNRWVVLDEAIAADMEALATVQRGDFGVVSRDRADRRWVVAFTSDDGPVAWYLWNRDSRTAELLFVNQPELARCTLARIEPVIIEARDGLPLPSYLALPPGGGPGPHPMILLVHGGPWSRDSWGFDPVTQWLANRGYAVLKVNYRGSTGFGKEFLNCGDRQWGIGTMQHDLTDAVAWAVGRGVADPRRVGIMGGSYGGYATLAGLTFTPELYACGVDIVGPSNIRTLLQSIPPYWAPMKQVFIRRVGDIEQDDEANRRISPLFHAARIRAPLIIAQGANDPRVNVNESDQMVAAMRDKGLPVTYVLYPDEGHGMARPENRLDFYGRVEEFLAGILGGRAEPWAAMPGTTAEIR
jgi:acetyl esterase/lipase